MAISKLIFACGCATPSLLDSTIDSSARNIFLTLDTESSSTFIAGLFPAAGPVLDGCSLRHVCNAVSQLCHGSVWNLHT